MEYTYRKGNSADLEQLQQLGLASYGRFKTVLSEEGWKKMEAGCGNPETYKNLLEIAQCFVCESNGKIIGMAFLIPKGNPVAFFEAGWAYIRLVGVLPGQDGKGIGKKLTQLCIDFAKTSGEKTLALHTSEFQDAARHIYESLGFKKLKELDAIFGKRYWLYTLDFENDNNTIVYQRAILQDLEALVELRIQFTTLLTGIQEPAAIDNLRETLRSYFTRVLTDNTSIWVLAKAGNTAVATGGILMRESPPNFKNLSGKMAYLVNIYTVPAFRRKGISSAVLTKLMEEARTLGTHMFELHATEEGAFVYKKLGFELHNEPTYRKYE